MAPVPLVLNCILRSEKQSEIFEVEIDGDKTVAKLKDTIIEKEALSIPASKLILRNVLEKSLLANDDALDSKLDPAELEKCVQLSKPVAELSTIFSDADEEILHIWVDYSRIRLLSLNCRLHGQTNLFTVEITDDKNVSVLKSMIKARKSNTLIEVEASDVILRTACLPLGYPVGNPEEYRLLDTETARLSSIFPIFTQDLLHVLVYPPDDTIQEHPTFTLRKEVLRAARKREPPSTGARNRTLLQTQNLQNVAAVYNGRPLDLTATPISIYHPVFSKFRQELTKPVNKTSFSSKELRDTLTFVSKSLSFYATADARKDDVRPVLSNLVDVNVLRKAKLRVDNKIVEPDGYVSIWCDQLAQEPVRAVSGFTEVTNSFGDEGCDPSEQAQCDFVAYCASRQCESIRNVCCCPAFLIAIAGPYIMISGAVFADRFISQPLTERYFLGGTPSLDDRIYEIAKILRVLKDCLGDLRTYYERLTPLTSSRLQFPHASSPHFRRFELDGQEVGLEYMQRLEFHESDKAVFKAVLRRGDAQSEVVVKFTPSYCAEAHKIAAARNSAPKLLYCEWEESVGMFVVVMDFVDGEQVDVLSELSEEVLKPLSETIEALHAQDLVHGDLRGPNVVITNAGKGQKRAMLIDFDWGGKEGVALYPVAINEELDWPEGVEGGGPILRGHDLFMLSRLPSAESDCQVSTEEEGPSNDEVSGL